MESNPLLDPITEIDGIIELRKLTLSEAEACFKLIIKNNQYLREWLPWLDLIKTVDDEKKFIQGSYDKASEQKSADFGIYNEGTLVGIISFHYIDKENKKTSIGYWLDKDSQGNGVMTKATKMLVMFAFESLKLNRIQIECAIGNNKSSSIPKRLGFKLEGVTRQAEWLYDHFVDWETYSLLSSDGNKSD